MKRFSLVLALALVGALVLASGATAQRVTLPASGGNQQASVTQHIGPVTVTIDYSSPDVTAPNGDDRRGKIWGELVHWGFKDENFGTCTECPWRAGANENTVFTVSHDVAIEGQPLAAGSYGLHMAAGEEEWTIIFSHNTQAWGSYFYDPAEDALRVKVKPEKAEYRHWLTYDFVDRQPEEATARLWWEDLQVPFKITVPDINEIYFETLKRELTGAAGFTWQNRMQAANFLIQNEIHLDSALEWAEAAAHAPFIGDENFRTLLVLAQAQKANGQGDAALETAQKALEAAPDQAKPRVQQVIDSFGE